MAVSEDGVLYFGQRMGGIWRTPLSSPTTEARSVAARTVDPSEPSSSSSMVSSLSSSFTSPPSSPEHSVPKFLYSNGATSCIICVLAGRKSGSNRIDAAVYVHADIEKCFEILFEVAEIVLNHLEVEVYAVGGMVATDADGVDVGDQLTTVFRSYLHNTSLNIVLRDLQLRKPVSESPTSLFWAPCRHDIPQLESKNYDKDYFRSPRNAVSVISTKDYPLCMSLNIPLYGPACMAYLLFRCGYWYGYLHGSFKKACELAMEEKDQLRLLQMLRYLASKRFCTDEQLRLTSTTPAEEPPAFFENSRTANEYAHMLLTQRYYPESYS